MHPQPGQQKPYKFCEAENVGKSVGREVLSIISFWKHGTCPAVFVSYMCNNCFVVLQAPCPPQPLQPVQQTAPPHGQPNWAKQVFAFVWPCRHHLSICTGGFGLLWLFSASSEKFVNPSFVSWHSRQRRLFVVWERMYPNSEHLFVAGRCTTHQFWFMMLKLLQEYMGLWEDTAVNASLLANI